MPVGAITPSDITSADWSLALDSTEGGASGAGIGNVVQGLDDVEQCIQVILTTPLGSDVLRPTFGCDLWRYVDGPLNRVLPAIVREVTAALMLWEPRITIVSIGAAQDPNNPAHLTVTVVWQLRVAIAPAPRATSVTIPGGTA